MLSFTWCLKIFKNKDRILTPTGIEKTLHCYLIKKKCLFKTVKNFSFTHCQYSFINFRLD